MDGHSYSGIRGYSDKGGGGGGGGEGRHPWTIHRWSYLVWAYADICPSKVLGNTKVTVSSMDDSGLSTAPSDYPPSHVCPAGLNLTSYSRRTCGRAHSGSHNCSSTTFSVGGSQYSRVCGRALAYQFGFNYAFLAYHWKRQGVDGHYVDGLSLTHGASGSRQHIWTFVNGLFAGNRNSSSSIDCGLLTASSNHQRARCPCDNGNSYPSPPFVGNDYFCESATQSSYRRIFYPNATLWDGQVCEGGGTCCRFNNPPWFTKNFANSTTEDIELRLCS